MVEGSELRADLLARIAAKRACVQAHLRRHRPRSRRLSTATIVLTSLAAALAAGPGVGGSDFTVAVGKAIDTDTPGAVWQGVCLGAALLSAAAAIATGLSKSQEATAQLNTAAAVDGELEGLAFLLEFGEVSLEDSVKLYRQCIAKIDFIEDDVVPADSGRGPGVGTPGPAPADSPADRRPPAADLPAVPPSSQRAAAGQTVPRRVPPRDTARRRLPPPLR